MPTFTLTNTFKVATKTREEEAYTYECAALGAKLTFHAHPTRAWSFVILKTHSNPLGEKYANKLIDAQCAVGMKAIQERGKEAFAEAIKTLTV